MFIKLVSASIYYICLKMQCLYNVSFLSDEKTAEDPSLAHLP